MCTLAGISTFLTLFQCFGAKLFQTPGLLILMAVYYHPM